MANKKRFTAYFPSSVSNALFAFFAVLIIGILKQPERSEPRRPLANRPRPTTLFQAIQDCQRLLRQGSN